MPRRKTSWALIIWTLIFAVWIIGGIASNDCAEEATQLGQDACAAGTGIGVALIFVLWFIGFVALSLVWMMTRNRKSRECPACGRSVKRGLVQCDACGYDFRQQPATPATST